uniref:Lipoprotein n=1 Tax=Globodera pallida TaxID=36090 RepID=A0A183CE34_GLOPA
MSPSSSSLPYPVNYCRYRIQTAFFPLLLMLAQFVAHSVAKSHYSGEHFPRPRADHLLHPLQQQSALPLHAAGGAQANGARGVNRCYSCMSPLYAELFKDSDLGKYFFEPRNFSVQCDDPMDSIGIGLVPCRGICLTLSQEFIIMGRKTGKRLTMRGCAASLSRHGYHNRTIAFFAEFDLCREVLASELFRLSSGESSSGEEIYYGTAGGFMAMGGPMNPMDGQPVLVKTFRKK